MVNLYIYMIIIIGYLNREKATIETLYLDPTYFSCGHMEYYRFRRIFKEHSKF